MYLDKLVDKLCSGRLYDQQENAERRGLETCCVDFRWEENVQSVLIIRWCPIRVDSSLMLDDSDTLPDILHVINEPTAAALPNNSDKEGLQSQSQCLRYVTPVNRR